MKTESTVRSWLVVISLVLLGSLAAALSQSANADTAVTEFSPVYAGCELPGLI